MATMGGGTTDEDGADEPTGEAPVSRRDYFAAAALQGLLAYRGADDSSVSVESAVEIADRLIKALDKPR